MIDPTKRAANQRRHEAKRAAAGEQRQFIRLSAADAALLDHWAGHLGGKSRAVAEALRFYDAAHKGSRSSDKTDLCPSGTA